MTPKQKFVLSIVSIIAVAWVLTAAFDAQKKSPENHFSVSAEGRVFAPPDIAQITFGVKTENLPSAEAATREGVEKMNAIVRAIKNAGVEEKDLKTTNYNLYPNYDYTRESGRELTGWNLDQSVQVKIRDLDTIGEVIARATEAGANQVGDISFTIDDEETLKRKARAEAIANAKKKAKEIARDSGLRLGKLINVTVSQVSYPIPIYARSFSLEAAPAPVPKPDIQTGENEVSVTVTLTYDVK